MPNEVLPEWARTYARQIGYISAPEGGFMADPGAEEPGRVLPLAEQYPAYGEYLGTLGGYNGQGALPNGFDSVTPTLPTTPSVPGVTPVAFPLVAIGGLWILRLASLIARFAALRGLSFAGAVAFIRASGMTILKWGGIAALTAWLIDMIDADPEQAKEAAQQILIEMQKKEAKGKRRRYTIGHNPRVRTLQRVARHTMKLLKRHDKYIREFFPKPRYKVPRPAARYLSPIEKAQLKVT